MLHQVARHAGGRAAESSQFVGYCAVLIGRCRCCLRRESVACSSSGTGRCCRGSSAIRPQLGAAAVVVRFVRQQRDHQAAAIHVHLHLFCRLCFWTYFCSCFSMAGTLELASNDWLSLVAAVRRLIDATSVVEARRNELRELLNLHAADRRHRKEDDEERQHEGDHVGVRQQPSHHAGRLERLFLLTVAVLRLGGSSRGFYRLAIAPYGYAPDPEKPGSAATCPPSSISVPRSRGSRNA